MGDDHIAAAVVEPRHPGDEPALLGGAVAGVLDVELRALAPDHLADADGHGRGFGVVGAAGAFTDGQVVPADAEVGCRLHARVAGVEAAPGLVHGQDAALGVEHTDLCGRGIERGLGECVRRPQRLLHALAFGDVGDEAVPDHAAIRGPLRPGAAGQPAQAAAGQQHAVFLVPLGEGVGRGPDRVGDPWAVVRVQHRKHGIGAGAHLVRRDAVDVAHAVARIGKGRAAVRRQAVLVDHAGNVQRQLVEQLLRVGHQGHTAGAGLLRLPRAIGKRVRFHGPFAFLKRCQEAKSHRRQRRQSEPFGRTGFDLSQMCRIETLNSGRGDLPACTARPLLRAAAGTECSPRGSDRAARTVPSGHSRESRPERPGVPARQWRGRSSGTCSARRLRQTPGSACAGTAIAPLSVPGRPG